MNSDLTAPNSPLIGFTPPDEQVTEFVSGEFVALQGMRIGALQLQVSQQLAARRLYLWLWADVTAATDFYVQGGINFFLRGQRAGPSMPIGLANMSAGTTPQGSSIPCVLTSGGQSVEDSIGLYIYSPVNGQPFNVILQPLNVVGVFDSVTLDITAVRNISQAAGAGIRAWLGIMSNHK
jgi:hypothetical protein